MKKIFSLVVLFVLTFILMAVPAMAATYDFSFSTTHYSGSGTLTVENGAVISAIGTVDGQSLIGAGILGGAPPEVNNGAFLYDNLFSSTAPYFDNDGIVFTLADNTYLNLYTSDGSQGLYNPGSNGANVVDPAYGTQAEVINNLTMNDPSPVPEPASLMLLGSGLLSLAGFARRRFLKA